MNGNQVKTYLYILGWVLMISTQFYTVCTLPIDGGGSPAQGKQAGKYQFIKLGSTCNHLDAFSKFSLVEIMTNASEHCDPRELLTCQTGPLGQKWCDCGLVNAKRDEKQGRCIALAGAPCTNVFGNTSLPMAVSCDLTIFKCEETKIEGVVAVLKKYSSCQCKDSNQRPDAEGMCGGWKEGGAFAFGASVIFIFVLCGVPIFMSYKITKINNHIL